MGAVYKARDKELERIIALKVIRPELASNPEILQRFKQELILARQVTDRNVIRIFDLGEAGGIKYITMEFLEGESLYQILRQQGKVSVNEALDIMRQMLNGLQAAHREGVIHRDLKPGNIMRDAQGRVVVMDFGLARSLTGDGMTRTGTMMGTMEYMSPEQAQAKEVDARSDIFTAGLICYELLTGRMPFHADSAVASLLRRMQERAAPASDWNATIPQPVSELVSRCLERDPAHRWQSAQEIIARIDEIQGRFQGAPELYDRPDEVRGRRPPSVYPPVASPIAPAKRSPWLLIGGIVLPVALAVAVVVLYMRPRPASLAVHKTVTVLLADFKNSTSDDVFEGTLEPAFGLALEGAPFVSTFNRTQARKIANQIKPGAPLDDATAHLVASREGINVVIGGTVEPQGLGYKVTCRATDALTGKLIAKEETEAADKSSVLKAVGTLASNVRTALGDSTPGSVKLAQQETYTTGSLDAAHEYAQAQELRYQGKTADAIKGLQRAIQLDPTFGSAYASLAALYYNAGNRTESLSYYKLAMENIDRMTDRERYRTRGGYYLVTANGEKAVEEFSGLVKQYPADSMGLNSLAYAYSRKHENDKALETARRAMEIYPKNVPYRTNAALYAIYSGKFGAAEKEASTVLEINPSYEMALVTIGLAQVGEGNFDKAAETIQKLSTLSQDGASYAASGLADMALYRSQPAAAIDALQKGIQENLAKKNTDAAAKKYAMLAEAYLMQGKKSDARAAIEKGVATDKVAIVFRAGRVYAQLGDAPKASAMAAELLKSVDPMPQGQGKLVQGEVELSRGRAREAIQLFQESQRISDTWLARLDLARAYIAASAFTDANTELDISIRRRGETTDIYADEEQTFRFFPPTYYYQGLVLKGLKSTGANDAFKNFLALKANDSEDPLVADARKRLGTN